MSLVDRLMSPGISDTLRRVGAEWRMQRRHAASARMARRLARAMPFCLMIGSARRPAGDWITIDALDGDADLQLDPREALPFADDAVARIYLERAFARLSYPNLAEPTAWQLETHQAPSPALGLLRECRRVLLPGGRLDLVVIDVEPILESYASRHTRPFSTADWRVPAWCDTPMHCVNHLFRQGGELQYAYDDDLLSRMLSDTGFHGAERRGFDPAIDGRPPAHALCLRARKPAAAPAAAVA